MSGENGQSEAFAGVCVCSRAGAKCVEAGGSLGGERPALPVTPWTSRLCRLFQFDTSVPAAMDRMRALNRTCNLIIGVGAGSDASGGGGVRGAAPAVPFRAMQYGASVSFEMDDTNMRPVNDSWHPRMENVVYFVSGVARGKPQHQPWRSPGAGLARRVVMQV